MKKTFVIHPILFAIFPILFLFSHNVGQTLFSVTLVPAGLVLGLLLLLFLLLKLVLKDSKKAGFVSSLFIVLFFAYGHIYDQGWQTGTFLKHRYLTLIVGLLFSSSAYLAIKTHRNLHNLTNILNIVASSLVLISVLNIVGYKLKIGRAQFIIKNSEDKAPIASKKPAALPDIYYIILDAYARADILEEIYDYENTELLEYLTERGFYIARRSKSNYSQTALSLASSLNMSYINDILQGIDIESNYRNPLRDLIRDNRVIRFLKQHGYVFVALSSGYSITEIKSADVYVTSGGLHFLDEFLHELINITPLSATLNNPQMGIYTQNNLHRKRILNAFGYFENIPELKAPSFVFAHILAPHPPFVFGRNGERMNRKGRFKLATRDQVLTKKARDEHIEGYREQTMFIDKKIKVTIESILSNSPTPPIIILQSDHGPTPMINSESLDKAGFRERLSILNAYYLPDSKCYTQLYDGMTPVNTFRIIFNCYFGSNYERLKDESFFSSWRYPYKFMNVSNQL